MLHSIDRKDWPAAQKEYCKAGRLRRLLPQGRELAGLPLGASPRRPSISLTDHKGDQEIHKHDCSLPVWCMHMCTHMNMLSELPGPCPLL